MQRAFSNATYRLWRGSYTPFTNSLLVIMAFLFVCEWTRLPIVSWLTCSVPQDWKQPWRIFTFSLIPGGIIGLILTGLLIWFGAGSLERSWGTKTMALFYGALCLAAALAFSGISLLFNHAQPFPPAGVFSGAIVAWCAINPDETIPLYGIIPIRARWIAVGVCAIQFFSYGWSNPIIGLMSLAAPGFAVLWVRNGWQYGFGTLLPNVSRHTIKRPPLKRSPLRLVPNAPKTPKPKDDRFTLRDLNPLEWLAKRRRRKQFEKLMNDD